jgi:tetratricopeptide (TPR) repeat protein
MKTMKLAALIAALTIADFGNHVCAQNEPSPAAPGQRPFDEPLHKKATDEAWAAFQAGRYTTAVTNADQCIARFGEAANRSQAVLESERTTFPMGKVSEADKKRIARYQILHDVATCFLIKGWAEEKLGHKEEASKAYTEAKKYTHARSSRPTGESFWSPAEKASEPLPK